MKPFMKKLVLASVITGLLILSGCSKSEPKKDASSSEEKEAQIKLIKNSRYVEPLNPTEAQIKAFNKLSAAVETNPDSENNEAEASAVAENFIYDFFTLANKESRSDIGGLQFIPSDSIRKYMEFAQAYYYGNYPTIVNEYGKAALPLVIDVKIDGVEASQFTYNNTTNDGYTIKATVKYATSDLDASSLKKSMSIKVIRIRDYDFNRSYDYTKSSLVFEGEMKPVYRILAVE